MSQKVKLIALLIFKIVLILFGGIVLYAGYLIFKDFSEDGSYVAGYLFWGFATVVTFPISFIESVVVGAKKGEADGNIDTIRDLGSTFRASNDGTVQGFFVGLITTVLFALTVGPFVCAYNILRNIVIAGKCIVILRKLNKDESKK